MAVLEIARFRLRDGVAVEDFLAQNTVVELEHVNAQPGYRAGSRHTTIADDGTWVISVGWESNADAEAFMASFADAPATRSYLDLIDQSSMSMERMAEIPAPSSRKTANARALYLEGIRDGKVREAVTAYTGDRYTQHSTGVRDGVEGFVAFFDRFVECNPERHIEIVRAIEDGPTSRDSPIELSCVRSAALDEADPASWDGSMTTSQGALPVSAVLAGLPVRDMAVSARWLSRLLGRPADAQPMDGLSDWYFDGVGTIQLVLDPQRAGGGILTIQVNELSAARSALADRGIDLTFDDTTSSKVKFGEVLDPDGNLVTLVEAIGEFSPTGAI